MTLFRQLLCLGFLCTAFVSAHRLHSDGCAVDPVTQLMNQLSIVDQCDCMLGERMPVGFNHNLMGGYLNMPSARMACEGNMRAGYASVPPYQLGNVAAQFLRNVEASLNYRVYRGIFDPHLSPLGYGYATDRGLGLKLAIALPEDSRYALPGIAIGADDFIGTKGFQSYYVVGTQVWPAWNFEASLGYGFDRLNGFFGGMQWTPWRCSDYSWLRSLSLVAEYDAHDYANPEHERHPAGRHVSSRINYGLKYRLGEVLEFSASRIRGEEFAWSLSASWDLGAPCRFLPLLHNPKPYRAPIITEPVGCLRTGRMLSDDLLYSFQEQGFDVWEIGVTEGYWGKFDLWITLSPDLWMFECDFYRRIVDVLIALTPTNIDNIYVTIDSETLPTQTYYFREGFLAMAHEQGCSIYELTLISPEYEVTYPDCATYSVLYKSNHPETSWYVAPKVRYLFGSSQGKFKYALGATIGGDGYLFGNLFYRLRFGYLFAGNIPNSKQDVLNPSQLPNVHTDMLTYLKTGYVTVDEAMLQRSWNLGCGFYSRISGGLFSQYYGGLSGELLFYPVGGCWAVGCEMSKLYKRKTTGIDFRRTVRKLENGVPTYIDFDLYQYFLDGYLIWDSIDVDLKVSAGRFLAGDHGVRFEINKTYVSGLTLSAWCTYTNGHDVINGKVYYDKGIGFSMPIDIFLTTSSRDLWGDSISVWLRDVGYRTLTGDYLFDIIRSVRL
jgi:hypothetical protein